MEDSKRKSYYAWRPVSLDYLLSSNSFISPNVFTPIILWLLIIGGMILLTMQLVSSEWIVLSANRVTPINFFIFNPPMIFGLLLLFWAGFDWAFIPVYLCGFIIAYFSQMALGWSLLVGLSFVLGLAIYALAYQSIQVSYTLRDLKSAAFFVSISFVASLASSMGSFIWSFSHHLSASDTLIIWQTWWSGLFFQSVLIGGPLLYWISPSLEEAKRNFITLPPPKTVSLRWIYGAVVSVGLTLVIFILSGNILGKMRVREVAGSENMAGVADIIGALEAFEIISWTSIGMIVLCGFSAIYILGNWNQKLEVEIKNRTEELAKSEIELKNSLKEKQILLQEIHHRVKNNLSQVHALLELQENADRKEGTAELLQVSRSRIRSMALAHEALYKHQHSSKIRLQEYIKEIIEATHNSYKSDNKPIDLKYNIIDTELDMTRAIPLGLLINEILINAHKHAFRDRESGTIEIRTVTVSGQIKLIIRDDGVGMDGVDLNKSKSLGMLLIRKFTQKLSGELVIESDDKGTAFAITIPLDDEEREQEQESEFRSQNSEF